MRTNNTTIAPTSKYSILLCVAAVIVACLSLYLQGRHHIPINDDVIYQFIFGEEGIGAPGGDRYNQRADTISKIYDSQVFHYIHANGRALIHVFIQIFAGILGYPVYTAFSVILLAAAMILLIRYTCPKPLLYNPLIWTIAAFTYLFLYPSPIGAFYWIVYGWNYLYPMAIVTAFLLTFSKIYSSKNTGWCKTALLVPFGILVGWSHEGFAIPLSGALFFYSLWHIRSLNRSSWLLIVSLWIGTLLLICSPANFGRLGASPLTNLLNGISIYIILRLFWVAVIVISATWCLDRKNCASQIKRYSIVWIAWGIGTIFCLIANTGSWGLMGNEFYASIAMFSMFPILFNKFKPSIHKINLTASILLMAIIMHQSYLVKVTIDIEKRQRDFISAYISTKDGLLSDPDIKVPTILKPWILTWFEDGTSNSYILRSLWAEYGITETQPQAIILGPKDYEAVYNPQSFFIPENKAPGNSPFYSGDKYYWVYTDQLNDSISYTYHYSPARLSECPYPYMMFKVLLTPHSLPDSEQISTSDIQPLPGTHCGVSYLPKSTWRTVDSINQSDL